MRTRIIFFIATLHILSSHSVSCKIIFVNFDHPQAFDGGDCQTIDAPCKTINYAHSRANESGDEIHIWPKESNGGYYNIMDTMIFNYPVRIFNANREAGRVVLEGQGAIIEIDLLEDSGQTVSLEGLALTDGGTASAGCLHVNDRDRQGVINNRLRVIDCEFAQCSAKFGGGAWFVMLCMGGV